MRCWITVNQILIFLWFKEPNRRLFNPWLELYAVISSVWIYVVKLPGRDLLRYAVRERFTRQPWIRVKALAAETRGTFHVRGHTHLLGTKTKKGKPCVL